MLYAYLLTAFDIRAFNDGDGTLPAIKNTEIRVGYLCFIYFVHGHRFGLLGNFRVETSDNEQNISNAVPDCPAVYPPADSLAD